VTPRFIWQLYGLFFCVISFMLTVAAFVGVLPRDGTLIGSGLCVLGMLCVARSTEFPK
jgi:hypothetical protein